MAEVLVTIGIIGVVAVLTLPGLIQKNIEKQRVTQLKKVYSVVTQAYMRAIQENGSADTWVSSDLGMYDSESHIIFAQNISKYLKLGENCIDLPSNQVVKKCHVSSTQSLPRSYQNVILSDNTLLTYRMYFSDCQVNYSNNSDNKYLKNVCGGITIDLNGGTTPPNELGKDIFQFFMTRDGVVPVGIRNSTYTFEKGCNRLEATPYPGMFKSMGTCAAWVIFNGNMDYLHCDDLSWDGKHKCSK